MLQNFHIKGFKGFRDLQLTDLARVTIIGGKNNVGKTSLLESISLFYNTANPEWLFNHLRWRDIDIPVTDTEGFFSPLFTDFRMDNSISFEVKDGTHVATMELQCKPSNLEKSVVFDISEMNNALDATTDSAIETSYQMNLHYEVSGNGQEDVAIVLRKTQKTARIQFEPHPVTIIPSEMRNKSYFLPLRQKNTSQDVARLEFLDITRQVDRVIIFLQVIEPQLIGLTLATSARRPIIYADVQGMDRKVPIGLLGGGMNQLLSIVLAIATSRNGIVLIDEIDAGIHHSVLSKVWEGIFKAAKEFNCQIIATTHSYECLQAAHEGTSEAQAEEDFSYIRLENHNNNIITKQYSHAVLGAALEEGWEVR